MNTTRSFAGGDHSDSSSEFRSKIFAQGKATFKVKPKLTTSRLHSSIAEGVLPQREAMFATNDSLIEQSDSFGLTRKQMFKVKSNYQSLCLMSQANKEPLKYEGIKCPIFIQNCDFLQGQTESIIKRVLRAAGIDVDAKDARIHWDAYLALYCMFEGGKVDLTNLAKYWSTFFDIDRDGSSSEKDYMDLLEKMIRGINF